ncbi:MAG TPA: GxxExxY protein [Anaerolineae bacterium]|nr:GxxExxY protein [Anaerolineae bacterium]
MVVHRELGHGFLEDVYHEALMIEFEIQRIPFLHEVELPIFYKEHHLKKIYRADFICFDNIIVELKALPQITGKEKAQVINYLKATRFERGLLFNFGTESLQYERLLNTNKKSAQSA